MPGSVYICPGDRQVHVLKDHEGRCRLDVSERLSATPSPDEFLRSVAETTGREPVGVPLSGARPHGADGIAAMRSAGARTLGLHRTTCVATGLIAAATAMGALEETATLREMPWRILESALITQVMG